MEKITAHLTLVDATVPRKGVLVDIAVVLGFACFTAAMAQVSLWIGPVPVTGQTFAVLLAGILLGSIRGALSQITYLAIGATGVPFWFALGGPPGIARLLGPSGGYLLGFVAAAFVTGYLAERGWDRHIWTTALAMLAGNAVIYLFGLPWLARFVPGDSVLKFGLYPFLAGDTAKIVAATLIPPISWRILKHLKG
jgi:biotin transporter BioY